MRHVRRQTSNGGLKKLNKEPLQCPRSRPKGRNKQRGSMGIISRPICLSSVNDLIEVGDTSYASSSCFEKPDSPDEKGEDYKL